MNTFMKGKIRVAHVTEAWKGGIATYVESLIRYQSQSAEFEKPHLIYSEDRTDSDLKNLHAETHSYSSSRNPLKYITIAYEIKRIIENIEPNIVHLHSSFPGIYGRLFQFQAKGGRKIPVVYCPHAWSFSQETGLFRKYIYVLAERLLSRRTEAIVNISRYESGLAARLGVRAKHNPVILSCLDDSENSEMAALDVSEDKINLGFVGRFDRQKGFDIFSSYMAECDTPDIEVYVVGDTHIDKKKKSSEYKNPGFTYLGWIENSLMDSYYQQLDAIVIPSRWEGFSLTALESLRNGKALIVSDRASLPEVVIEGYNGYIFSIGDLSSFEKVIECLDKQILREMGYNSRKIFETSFRGQRQNKAIYGVYKQLL